MTDPATAIVPPRVISELTGDILLLEDIVASHVGSGDQGLVAIVGGPLTGKTTAVEYLDRLFADENRLMFTDEHARLSSRPCTRRGVTVSTFSKPPLQSIAQYELAPWGRDEWIEYLLMAHRGRSNSVMSRLGVAADTDLLKGNPCLWHIVLDELARDDSISSATESLKKRIDQLFSMPDLRRAVRNFALIAEAPVADELDREARALAKLSIDRPLIRLLALEPVRTVLAIEAILSDLMAGVELSCLRRQLPHTLVRQAATVIKSDDQQKLRELLHHGDPSVHPMAASLLHAADVGWKPEQQRGKSASEAATRIQKLPDLRRAYLVEANWPGIDLRNALLSGAKMTGSNLQNATLDGADLTEASLTGAELHGASLARLAGHRAVFAHADLTFCRAPAADLRGSDFRRANLEGTLLTGATFIGACLINARFVRANLSEARLFDSNIEGADFTQANLELARLTRLDLRIACFDHASFVGAVLAECNFEGMELSGADFKCADLRRAVMTGSSMCNAHFFNSDLRFAGLADVEWEGANLRNADLRGVSFHLGSTRSGLVGSPYPSHGTRTGFYTDDFGDQNFKAPEEIRSANLRGADLRGAKIDGVDFYLVDLREAMYDSRQEILLRRSGAILETRAL